MAAASRVRCLEVRGEASSPAEVHVLGDVVERQVLQLLRGQDHAAVTLLILAHSRRKRTLIMKPTQLFLSPSLFSFDKAQTCVCDCPCVHACVWTCKQKWGSYIRGVWLIAGQFLKKLKCGHAPHVAAQRGFRFKTRAGNSTRLLSSLNLISCNSQMCTTCQIKRVLNGTIFAFSLITSGL